MNAVYNGMLCPNITTTMPKPVARPDPLHSPTAAAYAISSSPNTRSGPALPDGTVTIAEDAITSVKTATTPTPFVSQSQSA